MTAIDFAAFVDELATVSGETIRPFFRSALGVENKSRSGGFDPVTAADRAAEAAMRALIKRTFPEHGVIGEEFGADRPDAEYVWVLDPIDGTKSFICGLPAWGTLDRADAGRRADLRHDAPAVHRASIFPATAAARAIAARPATARCGCGPALRRATPSC